MSGGAATWRSYPSGWGGQGQIHPGRLAGVEYGTTPAPKLCLVADRVAGDEADVVTQAFVPARTGFTVGVARGVPAVAGDHGVGVAGGGVDGDPGPFPFEGPALHRAGG